MKYINYLDLPTVPEYLLDAVSSIIASPRTAGVTDRNFFQIREASEELRNWAEENIKTVPFKFRAHYQIIGQGIPIHRDQSYQNSVARTLAINYLLDTGGDAVSTVIYDDDKRILESEIIQSHRWHSIKVDMLHCVLGLQPGIFRVALVLAPI